jgi:hypothetical protein
VIAAAKNISKYDTIFDEAERRKKGKGKKKRTRQSSRTKQNLVV